MSSSRSVSFGFDSIEFLGHFVSKVGIRVDPSKIEAVKGLTRPTSIVEIWIFVGLALLLMICVELLY